MKLIWLQSFNAIMKSNSFSVAAEELFISQSNMSKYIQAMEEELGFELFQRTTRAVKPTEHAKLLYPYAQSLVDEFQIFNDFAKTLQHEKLTTIQLLTAPMLHLFDLIGAISAFRRIEPVATIEIVEQDILHTLDDLLHNSNAIAIARECLIYLLPKKKEWTIIPFIPDELLILCDSEHPFARRSSISLKDSLRSPGMVIINNGFTEYKQTLEHYGISSERLQPVVRCASSHSLCSYLTANHGFSMITRTLAAKLLHTNQNLVTVPLDEHPDFSFNIVVRTANNDAVRQKFIEFLLTQIDLFMQL